MVGDRKNLVGNARFSPWIIVGVSLGAAIQVFAAGSSSHAISTIKDKAKHGSIEAMDQLGDQYN